MQIWSAEIKELESLYTSIKGRFPELEKELEQLIETKDANVVMLYSRRCLEIIVSDLCEYELKRPRKTEPLKGIIDKLHHEEKVPAYITTSMHGLNDLSTFGAHPKEFDPQQVKPVLNNLKTIIEWYRKYKDNQIISKAKTEEAKPDIEKPINFKELNHKPNKTIITLLSGLLLVGAIVIILLFVFDIIGGGERAEDLTKLEKSIAVLPFENLSSDEEQAWFSDGITDVIINQLSKISDLRVLSRTSTLKYGEKEEKKSIPEIGEELGVNYLIEGTVQRQENKMRISVQLIRALNEGHVWSEVYDREWKDIFDVQSDIAHRIAEVLKTVLSPEEKANIETSQTKNPEAYNYYLQGRFFINKRTEEGFKKSIEYFERAVASDPDYALAYAGLADAYFLLTWYRLFPRPEGFNKSKEYVLKALNIDKNLAEAHTVLGALLFWNEWKWEEARKELSLAIELNPNFVTAHSYYSELLGILRQNDEARQEINIALKLDPFFPTMHILSATYYIQESKLNEALIEYKKAQEISPDFNVQWGFFYVYTKLGEDQLAIEALQKNLLIDPLLAENANLVKDVFNKSGMNGIHQWLIELELKKPAPDPLNIALWYAMMDRKEESLNWLEKAFEERIPSLPGINNDHECDNLRSEPRFIALIKKMGLSEYSKKE
jgi:TolB-like protein/Tfp pilus assembly protein PilF